ncbi:TPA: hypothetical protein VGW51_000151 [Streptococcus pyogenes]|nr:hypothetical protein [Streptococcus pyogenes]
MIKAQLKNLIKTIHLVKEAGFSLNGSLYMELLYDFTHDELVHNPIIESTVDTIQSVEFERVSFSYNGKDNVINDISFSIKAGERLAIVGGNGSGDSDIMMTDTINPLKSKFKGFHKTFKQDNLGLSLSSFLLN